jgi:hypothetical protein
VLPDLSEDLDIHRAHTTGYILGLMKAAGFDVAPEIDSDGNYTPTIILSLPSLDGVSRQQVGLLVTLLSDPE